MQIVLQAAAQVAHNRHGTTPHLAGQEHQDVTRGLADVDLEDSGDAGIYIIGLRSFAV
jgi:hypothetical protein